MRVVSIGDLVTDFYYKDGKLLGLNGGMSSHNIIANLSSMKVETSVFGVCGNDANGLVAIKSLDDLKIDTSNIVILDDVHTRCFHVSYMLKDDKLSFTSKKRCPFCNNKKWYDTSLIEVEKIIKKINNDDILVFDNLNQKNQEIIDNLDNIKLLDIGQYFEFEELSLNEIINKIKGKFKIINMNEQVEKYLMNRFSVTNDIELYKMLDTDLIIITSGKKGAKFLYNNNKYNFNLEKVATEIDPTGAGDAFFASIINDFIKNNLEFDEAKFSDWYKNSSKLTAKVVKKMGARGHLKNLYKIKCEKEICSCENFEVVSRKQIKRCIININNLETRILNAINSPAVKKMDNIDFKEEENYIFTGTGGSYAGANFASTVINELYGCNTYAMYPRDIFYRNNKKIDKIILFSYSGTTNDLLEGTSYFNNLNKYIITKGEQQKIVLKTGISKKNIISYRTSSNKGKERGFLSFEGALAPAAIFLKYYVEKNNINLDLNKFVSGTMKYWNEYFKEKFKDDKIKNMFVKGNIINIFRGDYTNSACLDIESKIIESGILNCIIHEKKNFSHGRFINYENLNNKNNIYFKQKTTNKYEEKLLDFLNNDSILIIESRYEGILCEFDLLVASQLLIYYIGKILNVDVSKPQYSEESMKIYFYKGEL